MTALDKRRCGPCNACCVVLEIATPQLRKKARVPCQHLTDGGCGVYAARPDVCQQFLCGWRLFEELGDEWRPDLSGVLMMRQAPAELPAAWAAAPYGVHLAVTEKCLNQSSGVHAKRLVRIYQHYDHADAVKAAFELWSDHVAALVGGEKMMKAAA